jgi:plasmid stabilization system protein ParE
MALKIKWSPRAASNLEEICNYIAKDSEYYSILFAKKIINIVKAIPQFPKSGRVVQNIRMIVFGKRFTVTTGSFIASRRMLWKLSPSATAPDL